METWRTTHTHTHIQKEEEKRLFGHSFCTLENVTKVPTADCVPGVCRVCAPVCVFVCGHSGVAQESRKRRLPIGYTQSATVIWHI